MYKGSPPHTWRTQSFCHFAEIGDRITSTYVENTSLCPIFLSHFLDHLHIRGEHKAFAILQKSGIGSPPHTWRTLKLVLLKKSKLRITSTYVENTKSLVRLSLSCRDHLHIRGEHSALLAHDIAKMGSPPHTWRTLKKHHGALLMKRITSTYVENT